MLSPISVLLLIVTCALGIVSKYIFKSKVIKFYLPVFRVYGFSSYLGGWSI